VKGDVTREPVNKAMKGGALFLGAIADYLKRVRDPDALPEWRGGFAAIVVDEAILNTPEYSPVRAFIRDHFYVKAVISIGRQAFKYLAHTDAKTSIIFLARKPEDGKEQVEPIFYAHAERVGYNALGNWVGDDLPRVRELYAQFRGIVLNSYQGAWFDAPAAIAAVEGMPDFSTEFYAARDTGGTTRLDFYSARYVQRVRELRERFGEPEYLRDYLGVTFREHPEPNRRNEYDFAEVNRIGTVRFKALQSVKYAPTELWIVREGDLVLSGIDAVVGAVAVAGSDVDGMVMSQEMYSYHVKDPLRASVVYLQLLLRSRAARELLEGLITGTSNRTRLENPEQLLDLPIPPLPPIDEQMQVARIQAAAFESRRESQDYERKVAETVEAVWTH
jgi:type I restriction enzyme M protein